jgi:hypothetical protein
MREQIEREAKWLKGGDRVRDALQRTMRNERVRANEGRGRATDATRRDREDDIGSGNLGMTTVSFTGDR